MTAEKTNGYIAPPGPSVFNPLIDPDGETINVAAVLRFLSWAVNEANGADGKIELPSGVSHGFGLILETCYTALEEMQ